MHRIDHTTADPNMHGAGKSGFTPGNPTTPTPSTRLTPDWCNDIQENIGVAIEGAGIALVKGDGTQLYDAIQALIAAAIGGLSVKQKSLIATAQTFAPGVADADPVRWDAGNTRWAKALADGTANDQGLGIADVTNAEVTLYGETRAGLMSGLTPGARYWLAAAGGLSSAASPADMVKIGVAKSATVLWIDIDAQPPVVVSTLTDAATIAWDPATQATATVTLSASRTLGAPSTVIEGDYYTLVIVHGAAATVLAYNAAYKGVAGVTLSAGNGAVDHLTFRGGPGGVMYLAGWRLGVGA